MPNTDLVTAVNVANLVSAAGGLLLVGVFVLSRIGARVGPIAVHVDELVWGGLLFAVVAPAVIVAGFGQYIVHANIGYYSSPDDYRNGAAFVNTCWFFIRVVAPAVSLVGFGFLGVAVFRRWRANHRSP
jgi:hypothetical protein